MLADLLAQRDIPTGRLIVSLGGAIVGLIVLGLVLLAVRRRLLAGDDPARAPLDMESLQRQKREGVISEDEFRSLRRALLGLPPEDVPAAPENDTPED